MNIAGFTIEIWEIILVVSLFFTITYVGTQISNANYIQAEGFANEIQYIGYLSENTNIQTKLNLDKKTKIVKLDTSNLVVEVKNTKSSTKISKDLIKMRIKNQVLIIN